MRLVLVVFAALLLAVPARAERDLAVGLVDDGFLYHTDELLPFAEELGVGAVRVNVHWRPGHASFRSTRLSDGLERLIRAKRSFGRIVVSYYWPTAWTAPRTPEDVEFFCRAGAALVERNPAITDVIIGNEPNNNDFLQPQFDLTDGSSVAPRTYHAILERCYDALHAVRPDVNVVAAATSESGNDSPWAPSNAGHSPAAFIRELGRLYRASGRTRPIFDTIDHHPYPATPAERPWRRHADERRIGMGDLGRLVAAYRAAFEGTRQATPGRCVAGTCVDLWLTEIGFQTRAAGAPTGSYDGRESVTRALAPVARSTDTTKPLMPEASPAPDHAAQLRDAIELAYCQPYVTAIFNFQLLDEPSLRGWQSGLLYANWQRKESYGAFAQAVRNVRDGAVDCTRFDGVLEPARRAPLRRPSR